MNHIQYTSSFLPSKKIQPSLHSRHTHSFTPQKYMTYTTYFSVNVQAQILYLQQYILRTYRFTFFTYFWLIFEKNRECD